MTNASETKVAPENGKQLSPTEMVPAGQELSVYDKVTDVTDFVDKLGQSIAASKMFGCHNVDQGRVLAMACLCEKTNPLDIARRNHIIGGNLSMKADTMLAEFRVRGGKHKMIERTPERAAIELQVGKEKHEFSFTWEEAKQEKFAYAKDGKSLKDNWATPRGRMQMLWARVVSDSVRVMMPEVNCGLYTPEELSGTHFAEPQGDVVDAEVVRPHTIQAELESQCKSIDSAMEDGESSEEPVTRDQLVVMKKLKDAARISGDLWLKILDKFGVRTAHNLTAEEGNRVISFLERRIKEDQKRSDLDEWADGIVGPKEEEGVPFAESTQET